MKYWKKKLQVWAIWLWFPIWAVIRSLLSKHYAAGCPWGPAKLIGLCRMMVADLIFHGRWREWYDGCSNIESAGRQSGVSGRVLYQVERVQWSLLDGARAWLFWLKYRPKECRELSTLPKLCITWKRELSTYSYQQLMCQLSPLQTKKKPTLKWREPAMSYRMLLNWRNC